MEVPKLCPKCGKPIYFEDASVHGRERMESEFESIYCACTEEEE